MFIWLICIGSYFSFDLYLKYCLYYLNFLFFDLKSILSLHLSQSSCFYKTQNFKKRSSQLLEGLMMKRSFKGVKDFLWRYFGIANIIICTINPKKTVNAQKTRQETGLWWATGSMHLIHQKVRRLRHAHGPHLWQKKIPDPTGIIFP